MDPHRSTIAKSGTSRFKKEAAKLLLLLWWAYRDEDASLILMVRTTNTMKLKHLRDSGGGSDSTHFPREVVDMAEVSCILYYYGASNAFCSGDPANNQHSDPRSEVKGDARASKGGKKDPDH